MNTLKATATYTHSYCNNTANATTVAIDCLNNIRDLLTRGYDKDVALDKAITDLRISLRAGCFQGWVHGGPSFGMIDLASLSNGLTQHNLHVRRMFGRIKITHKTPNGYSKKGTSLKFLEQALTDLVKADPNAKITNVTLSSNKAA